MVPEQAAVVDNRFSAAASRSRRDAFAAAPNGSAWAEVFESAAVGIAAKTAKRTETITFLMCGF